MKTESEIKIAILLTCHNRKNKTLGCLNSLEGSLAHLNYQYEVFLVDDASPDGTGDAVKALFPHVNVIQGSGNLFWNRGMNLAWKTATEKAKFDFFLWLNDDVILRKDAIEILMKDFQVSGNPESIIAGACQSETGETTYSGYISLTKKRILKPTGEIQLCEYFNGNVVLIPDEVFKHLGFLDPYYHHDQGDFDYGLRAKKMGVRSFVSSVHVGTCERHSELPKWCNPKYPLRTRWKSFKSPLGGRPKSTLVFQRKYMGLAPAVFHYFTIHLRLLFPKIWKQTH